MRQDAAYSRLRGMGVHETVSLPLEKWMAAKSAATVLKRTYGCLFVVNRSGDAIVVKRMK